MFSRNCNKFQLSAVYGFAEESVPWKDMTVLSNLTGKSRKEGLTHCCGVNWIEIVLQYSTPIELWLYCTSLGYTPVLKSSSVILWQENLRKTYFIYSSLINHKQHQSTASKLKLINKLTFQEEFKIPNLFKKVSLSSFRSPMVMIWEPQHRWNFLTQELSSSWLPSFKYFCLCQLKSASIEM